MRNEWNYLYIALIPSPVPKPVRPDQPAASVVPFGSYTVCGVQCVSTNSSSKWYDRQVYSYLLLPSQAIKKSILSSYTNELPVYYSWVEPVLISTRVLIIKKAVRLRMISSAVAEHEKKEYVLYRPFWDLINTVIAQGTK